MDTKACKTIKDYMAIFSSIVRNVGFYKTEYSKMLEEVKRLSETYSNYSEVISIVHGFTLIKMQGNYSLYVDMSGSRRMYPWQSASRTILRKYCEIPITVIQTIYQNRVNCFEELRMDMFSIDVEELDYNSDYYEETDGSDSEGDDIYDYRRSTLDITTIELLQSEIHEDYPMRPMYVNYYNMTGKRENVYSHYKASCMILAKYMYDKGLISSKPSILLEAIKSLERQINTLTDKVSRLEKMVSKDS